jgi:hypothetical protein
MNRYEITRVGLPITKSTVTNEFLDVITELKSNPNSIAITVSNDAKNAPEGYRILEQNGIIYKQIDVWESDRDPIKVTIKLLTILKQMHSEMLFDHVILFTPGNPYIDDAITKVLLSAYDDIKVVTTKGAPEIAADIVAELTGLPTEVRNYYDDFALNKNPVLDKSKATIFSCLQQVYNVDLHSIITTLKPSRVITVSVGENIITKQYTYEEILQSSYGIATADTSYTFAFIFDK